MCHIKKIDYLCHKCADYFFNFINNLIMSTVNISFDAKKAIKWLTFVLVISLFALPFIGSGDIKDGKITDYHEGISIAWATINGGLLMLRDAGWLWVLFMIAAPVAMHFTVGKNNIMAWIIRVAATFLAFLGALLLLFVWTKKNPSDGQGAALIGTWVYMIVSAALCGLLVFDGKDYFIKK